MSRESKEQVLSTVILDVLDGFIGTEGIYFEEIQDYSLISPKMKRDYLEKARDEDCHTFLDSLDLIYDPSLATDEANQKKQLDFLRALKTINDICHNNEVYLGDHGVCSAVEHFFRNYHQASDIPLIQVRAKEIVSEHIERQKNAAEIATITPTRTWLNISLKWREELQLPMKQRGEKKSKLNTARSNAIVFLYPKIRFNEAISFLERFKRTIVLNNFMLQWNALGNNEKLFWFNLINLHSERNLDHILFIFTKYHFLSEQQKRKTPLESNDNFLKTIEVYSVDQLELWQDLVPHGFTNKHLSLLCKTNNFVDYTLLKGTIHYFVIDQKKSIDFVVSKLKYMDDSSAYYWAINDKLFNHPLQKEAVFSAFHKSKNAQETSILIRQNYDPVIKKIPLLTAKLDAYLATIPDASNTRSNLFRNRTRTDTKKQHIEELKKNIEGCILISDIEKAIADTIAKVDALEKGVSRRISSNKCGACLTECQAILHDKPGKTRTFC